ncbi:MAG: ABC transporter substrate-binding protein [Candidatus Woykebacteria bacterium]
MGKKLRFYYHFLIVIVTKKYRQVFLLLAGLGLITLLGFYVVPDAFHRLYDGVSNNIRKPKYIEGIVGSVQTLNPVYTKTLAEKEISSLVFRSLMRVSEDGTLSPDIAESYTRRGETEYIFKLKDNLFWQDGAPITADDVVYTVELTQKASPGSDLAPNFKDVLTTKIDDLTVSFKLSEPYSPFPLNTAIKIVPKHIPLAAYRPIGSSDFAVKSISDDKIVLESSFANLTFRLYKKADDALLALKLGEVDSLGGLGFSQVNEMRFWQNLNIYSLDMSQRQIMLFFNLKDKTLSEREIRRALSLSVAKKLITQVLPGFNPHIANSSYPLNSWANDSNFQTEGNGREEAEKILDSIGWKKKGNIRTKGNESLKLKITISDGEEFHSLAKILETSWKALGANVAIFPVSALEMRERVIPERDFQALLTTQEIGADPDQYSLWHSSQIHEANVSSLSSAKIDKILEDARRSSDLKFRREKYFLFARLLADETPAIFLYYPKYFWVVNKRVENIKPKGLLNTWNRFDDIKGWKLNQNFKFW